MLAQGGELGGECEDGPIQRGEGQRRLPGVREGLRSEQKDE